MFILSLENRNKEMTQQSCVIKKKIVVIMMLLASLHVLLIFFFALVFLHERFKLTHVHSVIPKFSSCCRHSSRSNLHFFTELSIRE